MCGVTVEFKMLRFSRRDNSNDSLVKVRLSSLWQLIGTPCYITFDFISILTALDRDGTSLTPTLSPPV